LEIGPLANAIVKKQPGTQVFYADIRDKKEIVKFYEKDSSVSKENIVDIDYIIKNSYTESLKNVVPFNIIVMSHVLEHIPNLIYFFNDIVNVMKNDAILLITIPDKRYCFDRYRTSTSFSEIYDVYRQGRYNNPVAVLDFYLLSTGHNNPTLWWKNYKNYTYLSDDNNRFINAVKCYEDAINGHYFDVHFSVFTPESFLIIIYLMTQLRLMPFEIIDFYPTVYGSFEFSVAIKKNLAFLNSVKQSYFNYLKNLMLIEGTNSMTSNTYNKIIAAKLRSMIAVQKKIK
jgi:SAM-dependent methyltransferase